MNNDIFFSIIVPTYNRPELLERSLSRMINQNYNNYEIIVINDGGDNSSEEIVLKLNSEKIRYYWKENEQKSIAKNYGIERAGGDYIVSFDDDDLMYKNFLKIAHDKIIEENFPDMYYQGYEIVDLNGKYISTPKNINSTTLNIFSGNPFSNNGMFIKKSIIEMPLYLPRNDYTLSADWLLWIKLFNKYKCIINNTVTHGVTAHPDRNSANTSTAQYTKNIEIFQSELLKNNWGTQKQINQAVAHYHTYISLFLVLSDKNTKGLLHLMKGIIRNPKEIFTRRFLAIIKHLILK